MVTQAEMETFVNAQIEAVNARIDALPGPPGIAVMQLPVEQEDPMREIREQIANEVNGINSRHDGGMQQIANRFEDYAGKSLLEERMTEALSMALRSAQHCASADYVRRLRLGIRSCPNVSHSMLGPIHISTAISTQFSIHMPIHLSTHLSTPMSIHMSMHTWGARCAPVPGAGTQAAACAGRVRRPTVRSLHHRCCTASVRAAGRSGDWMIIHG